MNITCPKCKKQFELLLSKWTRVQPYATYVLDFDLMILTSEVRSHLIMDGEALMSQRRDLSAAWSEKLEDEGWIEEEWMKGNVNQFEVRRTNDGRWENRQTHKYWSKRVTILRATVEGRISSSPASLADKELKELLGYSWAAWKGGEEVAAPDGFQERPWTPIADEYAPSIETAYQRYIHHG
jgi:hypothetical protein